MIVVFVDIGLGSGYYIGEEGGSFVVMCRIFVLKKYWVLVENCSNFYKNKKLFSLK